MCSVPADQAIGQLERLSTLAHAQRPSAVGAEALRPTVWDVAAPLWCDGHFRQAVAAAEAVAMMVKKRNGRNDIAETALWQEAFSPRRNPNLVSHGCVGWPS